MIQSIKSIFAALTGVVIISSQVLLAETKGKVDLGPVFAHVDILESGHTVKRMDMWGVRGDLSYYLYKGLYVKPVAIYAHGGAAKGGLFTGSLSLGYCFPVHERLLVSPSVGYSYSHLWTKIDFAPLQLTNLRERFKSWSPFISLDIYYTFVPTWRVGVGVQYAWSRTSTSIQRLVKNDKSSPEGFTYNFLLEHDLSDQWSVNFGATYNLSLTKEKHGVRGTGLKLGVVRWF